MIGQQRGAARRRPCRPQATTISTNDTSSPQEGCPKDEVHQAAQFSLRCRKQQSTGGKLMTLFRRPFIAAAGTLAFAAGAFAADYPSKPVEYIIPFGPGGESDITARLQQPFFKEKFGQDLVWIIQSSVRFDFHFGAVQY